MKKKLGKIRKKESQTYITCQKQPLQMFCKKVFLKISQISRKNTFLGVLTNHFTYISENYKEAVSLILEIQLLLREYIEAVVRRCSSE